MINIVLIEPRIPQNTGNIGRLCVGGNAILHLIHPLGFSLSEKAIRRSGLDYWQHLHKYEWASLQDFWERNPITTQHFFLTTKSKTPYYQACFGDECFLYFGREDAGIDEMILDSNPNQTLTIPMSSKARSLNLATSVGIVLYEAIRQNPWYRFD